MIMGVSELCYIQASFRVQNEEIILCKRLGIYVMRKSALRSIFLDRQAIRLCRFGACWPCDLASNYQPSGSFRIADN